MVPAVVQGHGGHRRQQFGRAGIQRRVARLSPLPDEVLRTLIEQGVPEVLSVLASRQDLDEPFGRIAPELNVAQLEELGWHPLFDTLLQHTSRAEVRLALAEHTSSWPTVLALAWMEDKSVLDRLLQNRHWFPDRPHHHGFPLPPWQADRLEVTGREIGVPGHVPMGWTLEQDVHATDEERFLAAYDELARVLEQNPALGRWELRECLHWWWALPGAPERQEAVLSSQRRFTLAATEHWATPQATWELLAGQALQDEDDELTGRLLTSRRLDRDWQQRLLDHAPVQVRAEALKYGLMHAALLEVVAQDPALTREHLVAPDQEALLYLVNDTVWTERLETILRERFGLRIDWGIS